MSARRAPSAVDARSSPGAPSRRTSPAAQLLAVLAALAVLLTGCAQGERTASPAEMGEDGALKLRFMTTSPSFTDLPTAVILARGYFDKVGLDVSVQHGASSAPLITQSVMSGDADIGSSGTGALYNAYGEGMTELVGLGSTNRSVTFGLALNLETADKLAERGVTPDSPARDRVRALRGLKLTTSPQGSTGNSYLRAMLTEYGVDPDDDVTIMPNNDPTAQIATTRRGRADGFAQSFPRPNFPEAEGWGVVWLNWVRDLPQLLPLASQDYYTTRAWLKANPEAAERFMKALWLAHRDLQTPTAELRDAVYELPEFTDLNRKAFESGWDMTVQAYKGATPLTTEAMFEKQVELVDAERPSPLRIAYEDVYDLRPARAARPKP
ncbi:NitT/TauT family transport system substrate-binding protein [Streptomyces sp. BpilaLS-43]|nr:NitT/TauT family transport system substrate-binding protein [Streptomyces sp. BpilaLS-43]